MLNSTVESYVFQINVKQVRAPCVVPLQARNRTGLEHNLALGLQQWIDSLGKATPVGLLPVDDTSRGWAGRAHTGQVEMLCSHWVMLRLSSRLAHFFITASQPQ